LAVVLGTVLLRLQFIFTQHLDAGTVHQQMQDRGSRYDFNGDLQYLLLPAHSTKVRNEPVQARRLE
jgi:hypothetical protein